MVLNNFRRFEMAEHKKTQDDGKQEIASPGEMGAASKGEKKATGERKPESKEEKAKRTRQKREDLQAEEHKAIPSIFDELRLYSDLMMLYTELPNGAQQHKGISMVYTLAATSYQKWQRMPNHTQDNIALVSQAFKKLLTRNPVIEEHLNREFIKARNEISNLHIPPDMLRSHLGVMPTNSSEGPSCGFATAIAPIQVLSKESREEMEKLAAVFKAAMSRPADAESKSIGSNVLYAALLHILDCTRSGKYEGALKALEEAKKVLDQFYKNNNDSWIVQNFDRFTALIEPFLQANTEQQQRQQTQEVQKREKEQQAQQRLAAVDTRTSEEKAEDDLYGPPCT